MREIKLDDIEKAGAEQLIKREEQSAHFAQECKGQIGEYC
jgi:hypothetical protein